MESWRPVSFFRGGLSELGLEEAEAEAEKWRAELRRAAEALTKGTARLRNIAPRRAFTGRDAPGIIFEVGH